ncbi:MAG: MFS transporter, partial [Methylocystis sp.]|nr:MFS transporter [Methylocystis sp.]
RSSDRAKEQQRHTASAMLLAGCGLAASGLVDAPWLAMLALAFASIGTLAAMPTFWSHATLSMDGARAIVGVAAINSIGNLAGFVAPSFVGWAKSATGDYRLALLGLSLGPALTAFLLLRARR